MIRVVLLLDGERTSEELIAFSRLAVGLAAEGVHSAIVQSVEIEDLPADESSRIAAPIPTIKVPKVVPFWLRRRMVGAILDRLNEEGRGAPDAIVSGGRGCLWLAEEMARQLQVPHVVELRSAREVDAVDPGKADTLVAATPSLRARAARRHGEDLTTHLPVAVPRTTPSEQKGLVVALGPVGDVRRWTAMIDGLSGPGGPVHGLRHLALDLGSRRRDENLWRHVRRSTIADRMSSFDHTDQMRGLLAGAEVVIVPDQDRVVRSIESQARIGGGLVVAVEDPNRDDRDPMIGDRILSPAEARHPSAWREAIHGAIGRSPGSRFREARMRIAGVRGGTSLGGPAPRADPWRRDADHGRLTPPRAFLGR